MKGIIIWHNFQTIFPDQTYSCVGCQSRDGHSWCSVLSTVQAVVTWEVS